MMGSAALALAGFRPGNDPSGSSQGMAGSFDRLPRGPVVESEEQLYQYDPAENGAGPMWCAGSTCIVRTGREVYASGLETIPGMKPLNNCRWMLFRHSGKGWEKKITDTEGRTREPSPLAAFHDGRFFLSANPTLTQPGTYNGPSRPEVLMFSPGNRLKYKKLLPSWQGTPPFTEHSYRSFASDGKKGELILFQNIDYTHAEWSFMEPDGKWTANGRLVWPFGAGYEEPEPIRTCYPTVMLRNRAVYFCGVSDIIEPKKEWRKFKRELTGKEWDYDFRRLFFTWSDDITTGKFNDWIEVASREDTCGWIFPSDLWAGPNGKVHIIWTERALDERLREKFFPGAKQSHSLNYARLSNGTVEIKRPLVIAEEGVSELIPGPARFQITPDDRIFVIYYVKGTDDAGLPVSENRIAEIHDDGSMSSSVRIPLSRPFTNFFTATVRAGSKPSDVIDLLGPQDGLKNTISYARVRIS
jgi:hypothetical protein